MTLYVLLMYDCANALMVGVYDSYERAVEEKNKRLDLTKYYHIQEHELNTAFLIINLLKQDELDPNSYLKRN